MVTTIENRFPTTRDKEYLRDNQQWTIVHTADGLLSVKNPSAMYTDDADDEVSSNDGSHNEGYYLDADADVAFLVNVARSHNTPRRAYNSKQAR